MGAFGAHRFLGKSPPCLGHFDQKCPMLGIIGAARRFKAPGRESLVISCGCHFRTPAQFNRNAVSFVPGKTRPRERKSRTGIERAVCCVMDFGRAEAVEPLDSIGPVLRVQIGTVHADRVRRAWRPQ